MEEEISLIKKFLTEFNSEQIQSPTSDGDFQTHIRLGSYSLDPEDVDGQVMDWVLNYLDNRKCPYSLALAVAKEIAQEISASFSQNEIENAEKASNAANIYTEAMSKIPIVCNTFSNQDNLKSICSTKYVTSVFAIKNKRRKMEDRYVIHHDLNALLDLKDAPHQSYYAVFDGHSGIDAACYASAQLHINIAKHPAFFTDTPKAIIEGYQITDLNFLNKCNKWNIKSGSTAVCALLRENTIFVSWLGDSQAVLVKGGVPLTITKPHKPDREDERKRIENLGGHISFFGTWRVNGLLAVTRAIGDPDQKPYISSEPELAVLNLDGTEDFLILACDGLSDALSPEDITGVLYRYLADNSPGEPVEAVAAKLVHQSKLQGSEDNITTIVVFLRDVKDIKENAIQFLSNSKSCVQNRDFISMNGNMKLFNNESNSDTTFSKPNVLELNATSSKKLKNAANVMSSTGFGSTSYSYQYAENSADGSFQTVDPSVVDSAQNIFMSQNISASCFAPEATALSELPTPPIDDMLASQQFENFYSTDLYKELNSSIQTTQNAQLVDDINSNTEMNLGSNKPSESLSSLSPETLDDNVSNVKNMSLLDSESNIDTSPDPKISPSEAVGIACDVVSSTIETAVKCISSNETQVAVPLQSQLNPYAKPFVMKSFSSSEDYESQNTSFVSSELEDCLKEKKVDEQLPLETSAKISTESGINQDITTSTDIMICPDQKSVIDNAVSECSVPLDNLLPSGNFHAKSSISEDLTIENKFSEQIIDLEQTVGITDISQPLQSDVSRDILNDSLSNVVEKSSISDSNTVCEQISFKESVSEASNLVCMQQENKLSDISDLPIETLENLKLSSDSSLVIENIQTDVMNILPLDENKNSNLSSSPENVVSHSKTYEQESCQLTTQSATSFNEVSEQNQNFDLDNVLTGLNPERATMIIPELESKCEVLEKFELQSITSTAIQNESVVIKTSDQELNIETIIHTPDCEVLDKPELNQNPDSCSVSEILNSENISSVEAEIESKCEEIQKCIVDAVDKIGISETTSMIEPMSIIVKDELIPTEVPSDTVEDSRGETVAVDLKSLPEGIPEAEGVTEDIDSDSEKDGGWSYMKGNIASGSKSKPDEKASKTIKPSEIKPNASSKVKKDLSKPSIDIKNKARSITGDKTKGTVADKSKNTSEKSKSGTAVDKAKISAERVKTLSSVDKSKKVVPEKKLDVKSKVMKSSTLVSTTRTATDKTVRSSVVGTVRKEISGITKTTSTIAKTTKSTTLVRTNAPTSKPIGTALTERSTMSSKVAAKPKVSTALPENKPTVKNIASSTLAKTQISTQSKSNTVSTRSAPVRPISTVPSKTSTLTKAPLLKSAGESKLKQSTSAAPSTSRKPLTTTMKKSDVKEVKDSVNNEILAKKSTTTRKIESSSTLVNRRVASANNKSTVNKQPGSIAKSEASKRNVNVPKSSTLKSVVKKVDSKVSQVDSKGKVKIVESVQCKTDETKNNLNIESGQKNEEITQVTEEKFILEAINKEKVVQEGSDISNQEQVIVENGSVTTSVIPVEVETPVAESIPEGL